MSTHAVVLGGRGFVEHELACPDCGAPMRLYWQDPQRPPWYTCTDWPACKGAHGARWDGAPMGVPANKETRLARRLAHRAFDPLWARGHMTRTAAYAWLATRMGLPTDRAHISQFTAEQCHRVVAICRQLAMFLGGVR